jgi:MFS family permease
MMADREGPSGTASGYVLGLTLACSILSYMDRQVISLVVPPIKATLGLTDAQVGLLQGLAFTLCYAVAGLPLAMAVDRTNRVRVASACVGFWSLATAACGLVSSYAGLLAARAATATAESGFSPAALSILSDKVPPTRIARVSALFLLGPPLGTGFALLLGGLILQRLEAAGGLVLPGWGRLEPWQGLFPIIGLPGLLLALLLLLTVREPARTGAMLGDDGARRIGFVAALRATGAFLIPYVVGTILIMLVQFAYAAWAPTFFVRVWGFAPSAAGKTLGPIFIVMSVAGALVASWLAKREDGPATLARVVAVVLAGGSLLAPAAVLLPLVPSLALALVLYAVLAFAFSMVAPLATAPLLMLMPSHLRGRFLAAGGALLAIIGGGGGPLLVGFVTDRVFGEEALIGRSLAIVSLVSAVAGLLVVLVARRALRAGAISLAPVAAPATAGRGAAA